MHEKSIELLNKAVADELSAVHQYMYSHFHCEDQGYDLLAGLFIRTAIGITFALLMIVRSLMVIIAVKGVSPDRLRYARLLEQIHDLPHNPFVNALQLQPIATVESLSPTSSPLTQQCAQRSITTANTTAQQSQAPGMFQTMSQHLHRRRVVAIVVIALTTLVTCPRVYTFGLPRMWSPAGDHPAFTWLDFSITTQPNATTLAVGDDVDLAVHLTGWGSDSIKTADLVMWPRGGAITNAEHLPMIRVQVSPSSNESHQWNLKLRSLQEPYSFYVQTEHGRSTTYSLIPNPRPRIVTTEVWLHLPPYATSTTPIQLQPPHDLIQVHRGGAIEIRMTGSTPAANTIINDVPVAAEGAFTFDSTAQTSTPSAITARLIANSVGYQEFNLRLRDDMGRVSKESVPLQLRVIHDQTPRVNIVEPGRDAVALPTTMLPLTIQADDDLGIQDFHLMIAVQPGSVAFDESGIQLEKTKPPPSRDAFAATALSMNVDPSRVPTREGRVQRTTFYRSSGDTTIDLADLQVGVGDMVYFFAQVSDSCGEAFGGPHTIESATFSITILDQETLSLLNPPDPNTASPGNPTTDANESDRPNAISNDPLPDPDTDTARAGNDDEDDDPDSPNQDDASDTPKTDSPNETANSESTNSSGESGSNSESINQPPNESADAQASEDALREHYKDHAVYDEPGSDQNPRPPDSGSTEENPQTESPAQDEAMVYEFVQLNSGETVIAPLPADAPQPNSTHSIVLPAQISFRDIPARYRQLTIHYFQRIVADADEQTSTQTSEPPSPSKDDQE